MNYIRKNIYITIDSEFSEKTFLSLQVSVYYKEHLISKAFFANETLLTIDLKSIYLNLGEENNTDIIFVTPTDTLNILDDYLVHLLQGKLKNNLKDTKQVTFNILFFYTPKDLIFSFGFENIEPFFKQSFPKNKRSNWIIQNRCIFGRFRFDKGKSKISHAFICRDLFGFTNSSLSNLAKSYGVEMSNKKSLDLYKSNMEIPFQEKPKEFFHYGLGDSLTLYNLFSKIVDETNKLLVNALELPDYLHFSKDTFPSSNGKLVSEIFYRFLIYWSLGKPKNETEYRKIKLKQEAAFGKLSLLKTSSLKYKENVQIWNTVFDHSDSKSILDCIKSKGLQDHSILKGTAYSIFPFSYASIKWFLLQENLSFTKYNAIVSGGRCTNEKPFNLKHEYCADIDLSSCYGNALCNFIYPVGIPSIYSSAPNEKQINLKEFLKNYENELLPNLYTITVSGELTFEQDLIFSKLITPDKLNNLSVQFSKNFHEDYSDTSHVDADMTLLRKEIKNGIITSDILETLRKVSSAKELKEFMNLKVVTACFWKKSDMIEKPGDFYEEVLNSTGKLEYNHQFNALLDKRCKKWYPFYLKEFIEPLIKKRKELKNLLKKEKDEEKRKILNAEQNSLKTAINTTYGVLASLFFDIGNTVVANNITARARVDSWKMSKSLGLCQCITDGGFYQLDTVRHIQGKERKNNFYLPSFHTLSDPDRIQNHRNIKIAPLGDKNWISIFQKYPKENGFIDLDKLAKTHILTFWKNYDLPFHFDVEHKNENLSIKGATYAKAHYLLLAFDKETESWTKEITAIRGIVKDKDFKKSPHYKLLRNIIDDVDNLPEELEYEQKGLLKLTRYILNQKSKSTPDSMKLLRPGDPFITKKVFKCNNTWMFINTQKEYEKRKRRSSYPACFEKYANGSIKILMEKMKNDEFR